MGLFGPKGEKELMYELGVLEGKRRCLDAVMAGWDPERGSEPGNAEDRRLVVDVLEETCQCQAMLERYQAGLPVRARREGTLTQLSRGLGEEIERLTIVVGAWEEPEAGDS